MSCLGFFLIFFYRDSSFLISSNVLNERESIVKALVCSLFYFFFKKKWVEMVVDYQNTLLVGPFSDSGGLVGPSKTDG